MEDFPMQYERGDMSWASKPGRRMMALEPPCSYSPSTKGPGLCPDCDQQFRSINDQNFLRTRYRAKLTPQEAQIAAAQCTSNITRDLSYLKEQCAAYGNVIINRWKKKSREKREKILLTADPDMYPEQWLIPRHLWKYQQDNWPKMRERHKNYLLPYINVPDLRDDPSKFLSLLLNRIRFSPEQWAPYDNKRLTNAWFSPAFEVDYFGGAIIMYGSRYGQVTEWNQLAAHKWEAVGYPRGKLILEAQESMMALLRSIVEQLLEGIDETSSVASDKWNDLYNTNFKLAGSTEYWSQFLNQPFSPPPTFNIDKILSIAQAKMDAAGDHLWLLQTDPAYMRRAITSIGRGHVTEVSSVLGNYHAFVTAEILRDYDVFLAWTRVKDECAHVLGLIKRFTDNIHIGEPLPRKVDLALGALEVMVVNQLLFELRDRLSTRLVELSDFRDSWSFEVAGGNAQRRAKPGKIPRKPLQLLEKDPVHWALISLVDTHADQPDVIEHTTVYSVLDDHLRKSSAAERGRMTERLYNTISDTAALQEILNNIRLNRPLNENRDIDDCCANEDRMAWRYLSACDKNPNKNLRYFYTPSKELSESARLLKAFESVPLPVVGRPDQSWIDSLENRHAALSAFWNSIRVLYSQHFSQLDLGQEHLDFNLSVLRADTKPDYLEALALEKARLQARISGPAIAKNKPTTPIQTEWPHSEVDMVTTTTRNKKKSRPEATRPEAPQPPHDISNVDISDSVEKLSIKPQTQPANKVMVRQQTYNILTSMFVSDPKMIDWDAFVNAMNEVGFPATHTGNGSAVSFDADDSRCSWKGRINFHRPHPVAKIDPVMMHAMGKRMNKWFGWNEDTFDVAVKTEEPKAKV